MCIVLTVSTTHLFSQSPQIIGKVRDAYTLEVLLGVRVQYADTLTFTDQDGIFRFSVKDSLLAGVKLQFDLLGYENRSLSRISSLESDTLEVMLQPRSYLSDDVVISASKGLAQNQAELPVSITLVDPAFIDLQAAPEVTEIFNRIPGVEEQDGQISIRGSSGYAFGVGSRVMVAIDGLPVLSSESNGAMTDLIPVDNIARIEVLKGASSVLYGSGALGGVINIITQDPTEQPRTSIRIRGGVYDTPANKALDWDGDASAYEASAHLFHSRKIGEIGLTFQTDFIKNTGYLQGTDTEEFRGLLRLDYSSSSIKGLSARLQILTQLDSSGSTLYWRSYLPDSMQTVQGGNPVWAVSGGALTPTTAPGGNRKQWRTFLAVDPSIRYVSDQGDLLWYRGRYLRNTNANDADQSNQNYIFYHDFYYKKSLLQSRLDWIVGAAFSHGVANGDSLFGGVVNVNGETAVSDGRHAGNSLGFYTQLDGNWGKLKTTLGLRWERFDIDTLAVESRPILRLGTNYELIEGTHIRGSFGQAYRVPSVAERFTNTVGGGLIIRPNPQIQSETGFSAEIGIQQGYRLQNNQMSFSGHIDVAGFWMDFDNMIEFGLDTLKLGIAPRGGISTDVEFTTVNVADARIRGVEVTTINTFEKNKWLATLSGGITFLDPENLNGLPPDQQLDLSGYPDDLLRLINDIRDPEIRDQPQTLKYRSKQLVRLSGSVQYDKWGLSANYRRRSFIDNIDQYLFVVIEGLNDVREKHPNGEQIWDFILFYQPVPQHQLAFNIDNAFNEEYLIIPGTLAPQRFFSLQYQMRF